MIEAKKSLGQNFFINSTLADKIVNYIKENDSGDSILEIGPGQGFFTQRLLTKYNKVYAIEKDDTLYFYLRDKFPNLIIINEDILDFDYSSLNVNSVYSSLPYNISKRIISDIGKKSTIENLFFIIQKEVAEKYTSKDKKNSIVSILNSIYFDSQILFNISPQSFRPVPKVISAFIHMRRNNNIELITDYDRFEKLVHMAFSSPRKKLKNNIKNCPKKYENLRAENLSLQDFINLSKEMI